jgi:hypothetical protein
LDESFHIVFKNIMVHKDLRIFVFLSEAILNFFTYSRLQLQFKQKKCSNFILMFFESQCRIYRRFQNCSLIQSPSILSRDISHFLAQLLQNRHFMENIEKIKNFKYQLGEHLKNLPSKRFLVFFVINDSPKYTWSKNCKIPRSTA